MIDACILIAAVTIVFFVKKEDDTITIAKKISAGILIGAVLFFLYLFLVFGSFRFGR